MPLPRMIPAGSVRPHDTVKITRRHTPTTAGRNTRDYIGGQQAYSVVLTVDTAAVNPQTRQVCINGDTTLGVDVLVEALEFAEVAALNDELQVVTDERDIALRMIEHLCGCDSDGCADCGTAAGQVAS